MKNFTYLEENKKRKYYGYTLLELLIVVSIMIIVFMIGFTNYRDYQRRQQLESGVRQVKSDLSLAQTYAITGKKPDTTPDNICETNALIGYAFVRISTTSYRIEASCSGGNVTVVGPIAMPTGIQITSMSGTPVDSLVFHVLGRGVDRPSDTTITLVSTATGTSTQVVVSQTGEIR